MSFLDRVRECNRHDLANFVPLLVDGIRVGWVRHALADRLCDEPGTFERTPSGRLRLAPRLRDFESRSAAVDTVVRRLEREGVVAGRRDEFYPVAAHVGGPPLLKVERAAVPALGIASCGVHMTGFVRARDGLRIWVPRRSRTKSTYPGMLDNTVAGGQPIGLGIFENLVKECAEEAAIPPDMARRALPMGTIGYCLETPDGLKPDVQFCFDLEMPPDFVPRPADGEMEGFELWPVARVMETVRETREFKFNCNLVLIDFFLRHGLIASDDPERPALLAGLRPLSRKDVWSEA